jgi:hypothetical protein
MRDSITGLGGFGAARGAMPVSVERRIDGDWLIQ